MTPVALSTLWRIARRDLSASFRGLRLLFLCLFLGVAALAAIGSLTAAITGELTRKGRELLGGDIEIALTQRYATKAEKQVMADLGRVSETVRLRAMARGQGRRCRLPSLWEPHGPDPIRRASRAAAGTGPGPGGTGSGRAAGRRPRVRDRVRPG